MSCIALFGGTFNPIHNGHIQIINETSKLKFIDKVLVIPDNLPPHKDVGIFADNHHRVNMCRLAIKGIDKVQIDESELLRGGKSYTYDTLRSFKQKYPNDKLYFVCGGDMLVTLHQWYKAEDLFKLCSFIAFGRNGTDSNLFFESVEALKKAGADIIYVDTEITAVSSTELRHQIINGKLDSTYLPQSIVDYIIDNKVYG